MNATSTVMQDAAAKAKAKAEAKPAAGPAIKSMLPRYADAVRAALPAVMTPERFLRIAQSAISTNPALLETTPESFFGALMTAAQLGLEPNTPLGQAYLIPFENTKKGEDGRWYKVKETQFQLGYKGAIALAYRSGEVSSIQAEAVYENDDFVYEMGLEPKLRHVPARTNRGRPTHYYAVWKTKSGTTGFCVMSIEDVQDVAKKSSKTYGSDRGPWAKNFDEMAKKTVLKRALKYAPVASDFARAAASDEAVRDYDRSIPVLDAPVRPVGQIEDDAPADPSPAAQEAPSAPSDAQTPPTAR